jgi:hypothetical protein
MSTLPSLAIIGGPVLDGAVALSLEHSHAWSDADVGFITARLESFVRAGALAAYTAPKAAPGTGELELLGPGKITATGLTFQLRGAHLDARAFQLLRHMVSRLESEVGSLRHMFVVGTTPGAGTRVAYPAIDFDNEADHYPEAPAKPGFAVLSEEGAFRKARRVLVEFPAVVEGKVIDELEIYAMAWGELVEHGAFTMPIGLPDVIDNVMGVLSQFDAITFEIEIPVFNGSELGFDALLHMLAAYHVRVAPLRVVTID